MTNDSPRSVEWQQWVAIANVEPHERHQMLAGQRSCSAELLGRCAIGGG